MKSVLLLCSLYTLYSVAMLQTCKEYMWGITRLDEVPQSAQALVDKKNKLVGYHIRHEENKKTNFTLFDVYKKKLSILEYADASETNYRETSLVTDKEDPLYKMRFLIATWKLAVSSAYQREKSAIQYEKDLEKDKAQCAQINSLQEVDEGENEDEGRQIFMTPYVNEELSLKNNNALLTIEKPLVLDFETFDFMAVTQEKLKSWWNGH